MYEDVTVKKILIRPIKDLTTHVLIMDNQNKTI